MCGRFTLATSSKEFARLFQISNFSEPIPLLPNICPSQPILSVVRNRTTCQNEVRFFQWGLIPSWSKDPAIGSKLINARAETISEKPSFRAGFRHRRCLIPAEGFYEWFKPAGEKNKRPIWIGLRNHALFAIAGLWETWGAPDGGELDTCTIITTTANDAISHIHQRMPVIISEADFNLWLDVRTPLESLQNLLRPYPAAEILLSTETAETRLSPLRPPKTRGLFDEIN